MALGFGFRCGFLGLLHMEIVQERLEREFDARPDHHGPQRATAITKTDGAVGRSTTRRSCRPLEIASIEEPFIEATIITPTEFVGGILELCEERRGCRSGIKLRRPRRG